MPKAFRFSCAPRQFPCFRVVARRKSPSDEELKNLSEALGSLTHELQRGSSFEIALHTVFETSDISTARAILIDFEPYSHTGPEFTASAARVAWLNRIEKLIRQELKARSFHPQTPKTSFDKLEDLA